MPLNPRPTLTSRAFLSFKSRDGLPFLLRRHGFSDQQIYNIHTARLLPDGLRLAHGEVYRLSKSSDGAHVEVRIYEPIRNRAYAFWRYKASSGGEELLEDFRVKTKLVSGRVRGSLLASIMAQIPHKWAAHRFMDAYSLDFNLPRELQRGAKFSFEIETKWDGKDFIGYGEVLKTSLEIYGQKERRLFVGFPGGGSFISPDRLHSDRPLFAPVNYLRLSSLFNSRRYHPIKERRQPHLGMDFELPQGEDVFAAQSGVVLRMGRNRGAGNFVVLRHRDGLETYYNHLLEIDSRLRPATPVGPGQRLGAIGCTGYCTQAHLHFAVKKRGRFVDPARLVKSYPYRGQRYLSQFKVSE